MFWAHVLGICFVSYFLREKIYHTKEKRHDTSPGVVKCDGSVYDVDVICMWKPTL